MTVGEYEERFRRPASSWHQILSLTQDPIQTRRRRRRCLVATALLAVMTLTIEIASHHTAHSPCGEASASQNSVPEDAIWRLLSQRGLRGVSRTRPCPG
jgi:hypothetical protein